MLQDRCSRAFTVQDRQRGKSYFEQGRVDLHPPGADGITATVEGSGQIYFVALAWTEARSGLLSSDCTCPRFRDVEICKHLWATILAIDTAYPNLSVPGKGSLVPISLSDDSLEDLSEPDFREEPYLPSPGGGSGRRGSVEFPLGGLDFFDPFGGFFRPRVKPTPPPPEGWRSHFARLRQAHSHNPSPYKHREAHFLLDIARSRDLGQLALTFRQREGTRDGKLGKLKALRLTRERAAQFPDPADREILELLLDASGESGNSWYHAPGREECLVKPSLYEVVLPRLVATGRFGWASDEKAHNDEVSPLGWDGEEPWRLVVEAETRDDQVRLRGRLRRGEELRELSEPLLLLAAGAVVFPDRVARLETETFPWITLLRGRDVVAPLDEVDALLGELWSLPALPELVLPPDWSFEEVSAAPRLHLRLRSAPAAYFSEELRATVSFDYDGRRVGLDDATTALVDSDRRHLMRRDPEAEKTLLARLSGRGFRKAPWYYEERTSFQIPRKRFERVLGEILDDGWLVEHDGRPLRRPGSARFTVSSGIDWFELDGDVDFDGVSVGFPRLLEALRSGETSVALGDGSFGHLPADWLRRYQPLAEIVSGSGKDGAVRLQPSQAFLLDALLAAEPRVDVDRKFQLWRERLRSFERIEPRKAPRGFQGELRSYQCEALGWFRFLQEFGFGGCLADDMGLGKTVQVLAFLLGERQRRRGGGEHRPSLVVAPRSVLENWIREAERFTPRLRVLCYHGPGRAKLREELASFDLVVTTYATLRRDVVHLKKQELAYLVLDEAQNVKTFSSQAAKACRLLSRRHSLALTGTPVENHLGELWSIFEILNPGMLGRLPRLRQAAGHRTLDADTLATVAVALKPFILRRTKEQVLKDLPEKTEQTLICELGPKQRKLYDELRDHFRAELGRRIETGGMKRAKIHVLEALLRLRQAACHPGLVDKSRRKAPSAKLDLLSEQLAEIVDEGHKALVFSQFTSLLALLRARLDAAGLVYEYLDGRTRNRQERVDRFQGDPSCPLFLVSLKAGGTGLNLTAADYVYILDPWWNPAVEAQAVDRSHRIGQTRPVFAYRLIAGDTVEEKILALQKSKRRLAEAILTADRSMISELTAEDLQFLLS